MTTIKIDNTFIEKFSKEFRQLYAFIRLEGFLLTLVGGGPRDYLLTGQLSQDLDFELRHEKNISGDDWIQRIKELGKKLNRSEKYKVEFLAFSILRVSVGNTQVELASPRVERYDSHRLESLGHKDFKAILSSRLDYSDAFLRRDFTVNAIGIELEGMNLIDPFGGVSDLNSRTLRLVGKDFFKDPVRFLRMVRFALKLDFRPTKELEERLNEFDLRSLTNHYFLSEGLKSDFFAFAKRFFETIDEHKILISPIVEKVGFFRKVNFEGAKIARAVEIVPYLLFRGEWGITHQEIDEFVHFATIKKKIFSNLTSFKKTLEQLLDLTDALDKLCEEVKEADRDQDLGLDQILEREELVLLEKFYLSRERLKDIWDVIGRALLQGPLQAIYHLGDSIIINIERNGDITSRVSPKLKIRFLIYNQLKQLNT